MNNKLGFAKSVIIDVEFVVLVDAAIVVRRATFEVRVIVVNRQKSYFRSK
jgi:hypothetical protein